jgi:hypothetical protein
MDHIISLEEQLKAIKSLIDIVCEVNKVLKNE